MMPSEKKESRAQELAQEIRDGSETALHDFWELFSEDIYNFPMRFFSLSEDDAGDFYVYALEHLKDGRKLKSFQGKSKFTTWFYAVLKNLTIDFLRSRREEIRTVSLSMTDESGGWFNALENIEDRAKRLHDEDLEAQFKQALGELKLSERVLFKLIYIFYFDFESDELEYLQKESRLPREKLLEKLQEMRNSVLKKGEDIVSLESRLGGYYYSIMKTERRLDAFFRENRQYPWEPHLWSEEYNHPDLPVEIIELIRQLSRRKKRQISAIEQQKKSLLNVRTPYKMIGELLHKQPGVISVQLLRIVEKLNQLLFSRY